MSNQHRQHFLHRAVSLQRSACCRLLQQGDFLAAGQVLADVENMTSGIFSPALRAHQLCLWARLRLQEVQSVAVVGSQESAELCLQALCACEWARALAPTIWRQVITLTCPTFLLLSYLLVLSMTRLPLHAYIQL